LGPQVHRRGEREHPEILPRHLPIEGQKVVKRDGVRKERLVHVLPGPSEPRTTGADRPENVGVPEAHIGDRGIDEAVPRPHLHGDLHVRILLVDPEVEAAPDPAEFPEPRALMSVPGARLRVEDHQIGLELVNPARPLVGVLDRDVDLLPLPHRAEFLTGGVREVGLKPPRRARQHGYQ